MYTNKQNSYRQLTKAYLMNTEKHKISIRFTECFPTGGGDPDLGILFRKFYL